MFSTTDLNAPWNIETEVFPQTNQPTTPFTVPQLERSDLFLWARDWTGVTSGSNQTPSWWFWYFGMLGLSDTNLDSGGHTLLSDYQLGKDPNLIAFNLLVTNQYVNIPYVPLQFTVTAGTPFYMATLVDDTNLADANWIPYNPSPLVPIGTNEGWHQLCVGLRGSPPTARQTWAWYRVKLLTTPPLLVITNPATTTVMQPMIQVQGYCPEPVSTLSLYLSNTAGLFTNLQAFVLSQYCDSNTMSFTTNTFQAFDVPLASGANVLTFQATDPAGNVTVTNVTLTLDYTGKTNAPAIQMYWPQNGDQISGTEFTLRGVLDDFTASLTAQIVNASGQTNVIQGLVERNGLFWVENVPLLDGTNYITLTAMDAVSNVTTTNLTVHCVNAGLTIDDYSGQLGGNPRNVISIVTGTVTASNCAVWVNGVQATQDGQGNWEADSVPVGPGGTAVVEARAIPNSDNNGSGTGPAAMTDGTPGNPQADDSMAALTQIDQPMTWYLQEYHYKGSYPYTEQSSGPCPSTSTDITRGQVDYACNNGGAAHWYSSDNSSDCHDASSSWANSSFSWPCDQCPATEVDTYSDAASYTNTTDMATAVRESQGPLTGDGNMMPMEEWSSVDPYSGLYAPLGSNGIGWNYNVSVNLSSRVTLQTGGKGIPGRQSLFEINASAVEYLSQGFDPNEADELPPGEIRVLASSWTAAAVPPGEVTVLGQSLGSDGMLPIVMGDNLTVDFTPQVPSPNHTYSVGAVKLPVTLTANGVDLSANTPTFCVGQQVNFGLSVPADYVNATVNWTLPGKFVNHSWQATQLIPNPPGVPITMPVGSVNYDTDDSLLRYTTTGGVNTSCWYVNGSGGTASVGAYLMFPNGKGVSVAAIGKFLIYRPQITSLVPTNTVAIVLETNAAPNIYLGLGDSVGVFGGMTWDLFVNVNSAFPGKGFYVQLLNRYLSWDQPYFFTGLTYWSTTSGSYWLDTSYPYGGVDPIQVVGAVTNMNWNYGDSPGITGPLYSFAECIDEFMTYVCFQPKGGIPVTIGRVDWAWHGRTVLSNGLWTLTIGNITGTMLDPSDDSFPEWQQVYLGTQ